METKNIQDQKTAQVRTKASENQNTFSFLTFLKAIKANSEIRKQIRDIVDLGLFEYAISKNNAFIRSVQQKAENESLELMMHFTKGAGDFQKLKKRIHKNRVIKTLAMLDRKYQSDMVDKLTHQGS